MNATHTPGPWITKESTEHWGRVDVTVCAAFTANDVATAWQGTTAVNRANARLIAAAPDLLEALKSAADWIGKGRGGEHIVDIARAAIAKATEAANG